MSRVHHGDDHDVQARQPISDRERVGPGFEPGLGCLRARARVTRGPLPCTRWHALGEAHDCGPVRHWLLTGPYAGTLVSIAHTRKERFGTTVVHLRTCRVPSGAPSSMENVYDPSAPETACVSSANAFFSSLEDNPYFTATPVASRAAVSSICGYF